MPQTELPRCFNFQCEVGYLDEYAIYRLITDYFQTFETWVRFEPFRQVTISLPSVTDLTPVNQR